MIKRIKYFFLITSCIFQSVGLFGQTTNVLFGERDLKYEHLSLFIDKEGSLYPNYFISNLSLDSCNASLIKWYGKHQTEFVAISKQYSCSFGNFSIDNCSILNDSIISYIRQSINSKKIECTSVSFLIHGYRKPFVKTNGDRTSPTDYHTLEQTLDKNIKTLYVEVYWDAMYSCCFSTNTKENKILYHLLEEAEKNALPVGHSLRKVLYNLSFDTINIVTHSLGARVATNALYNLDNFHSPTPSNKRVNICLIAPALSGEDSFKNYYNRQTDYNFKNIDNYKLAILYNENDFVLRKKVGWFGPGPYKYVNTTLGCNTKDCAHVLQKYFLSNYANSSMKVFDGSNVGQCHLVSCYCNSDSMVEMIEWIKD